MNFFEILEIHPPRLSLDPQELEKKFYELSRRFHPDHAGADTSILEKSALLNGAYRTLKDPWSRANYILKLSDLKLGSKIPSSLAALYFEMQESDDKEALEGLKRQLLNAKEAREKKLHEAFEFFDSSSDKAQALKQIEDLILENNYTQSMLRDLENR